MSWMQRLYETYEKNAASIGPISHTFQNAHIDVTIDGAGNFCRAAVVSADDKVTLIPATEDSAGRSSGGAPHPLCDKIQYVAGDYKEFGGSKPSYFDDFRKDNSLADGYVTLLQKWVSAFPTAKSRAVLKYVTKRTLVADLVKAGILVVGPDNKLTSDFKPESVPPIFKVLSKQQEQGDALVRWRVEIPGEPNSEVWNDKALIEGWVDFYASQQQEVKGFCQLLGKHGQPLTGKFPAKIRHGGDKAKLFSSNDKANFTYRGRFLEPEQALSLGFEVTQKAHNALRWLVENQAFRNGDQVFVVWAISAARLPDLFANSNTLFGDAGIHDDEKEEKTEFVDDSGRLFARRIAKWMKGYSYLLENTDGISILGMDSATPGRMSLIYYGELTGSELLERIRSWHERYAWFQNYSKDLQFIGMASVNEIAEAAFGKKLDGKLKKATVARLLPCITEDSSLPIYILNNILRRTCNRIAMEAWEWRKQLGIACGLYNGSQNFDRRCKMSLEEERTNRDYLYGRLLAIADKLETMAIKLSGENRETNAARLMQRFSEHPFSTWLNIEKSLAPYKSRLKARRPSSYTFYSELLNSVHSLFLSGDYENDSRLSGEFLLGYHCQMQRLGYHGKLEADGDANGAE